MDPFSLATGFLVGAFTGAAGQYLAEKYTDERRSREQKSRNLDVWANLEARFPQVIGEMKDDVNKPKCDSMRYLFVKSSKSTVNMASPAFEYHTDAHSDLQAAIDHLEELKYIEDVTRGNCPKYRMREHFVDKLRENA